MQQHDPRTVSRLMKWLLSANVAMWALLAAINSYIGSQHTVFAVIITIMYMLIAAMVIRIIFNAPEKTS